jgi:predicted TPR repeat methyltransferase
MLRRLLIEPFDEQLPRLLEREVVGSCKTLLDIGCGFDSPIKRFSHRLERTVGIDVFAPYIARSRAAAIHSEYHETDALAAASKFGARAFDCVVAVDLIEHLEKPQGIRLLEVMERMARCKVIVFTPNGFVAQAGYDDNPYQAHRSGWSVNEMRERGYRIWGVHGWKPLRGERSEPRWKPYRFWATIALWTQPLVERRPEHAFHLLCVKDIQ